MGIAVDPAQLRTLALAAADAAGALDSRALRVSQAEQRTRWKGPGRERYDDRSREVMRHARRLAADLRDAVRTLSKAAQQLEDELAALYRDEQSVRAYVAAGRSVTETDPAKLAVAGTVRTSPPPRGDPEWARLARKLYHHSYAKVP
jgi:uncharacterized protein YukE